MTKLQILRFIDGLCSGVLLALVFKGDTHWLWLLLIPVLVVPWPWNEPNGPRK